MNQQKDSGLGNGRLMVVTDGSQFSEGAIQEAIRLAGKGSGKLCAISVLEMHPEYQPMGDYVSNEETKEILTSLQILKGRAERAGVLCETVFRETLKSAFQEIHDECQARNIDMIVVGRRGYTGVRKLLKGELAFQIIGNASCQVLVVPRAAKIRYENLLVAIDGSQHSDAAVINAARIAKLNGSNVIFVSAGRTESELSHAKTHIDNAVAMCRHENLKIETLTPLGKPYEVIAEIAEKRKVDLIIMGAYGRSGLPKILMGSSTENVIALAGCAVLVVK
jgi:nucleotide-binding universal stress UspA family protein